MGVNNPTRDELLASIAQARSLSEEWSASADRLQAQLTALPKERVRLRADEHETWPYIYAGNDTDKQSYIASVCRADCLRHNIDPAALAAHICRFGEPDVTREMEALEAAVRGMKCVSPQCEVCQALAALDHARKGGAA